MLSEQCRVLIVADDLALRRVLRTHLTENGLSVAEARSIREACKCIQQRPIDLLVIDVNNPSGGAVKVLCREVRDLQRQIGLLLIIERDFENNVVQAIESGTGDYITKPFRAGELIGRCHLVLRRSQGSTAAEETSITVGELELDIERRQLRKSGKVVHLTPTEFSLLTLLMRNRGVALDHGKLLRTIWGPEYGGELEYLRSYIRLLRKKIETDPAEPKYLLTEPWLGYRFSIPYDSKATSTNARQI
jgi:two-component system KDP operon response regulator KdpE